MSISRIRQFIEHEAAGGLCLIAAATIALICANFPALQSFYVQLTTPTIVLVVNDGLMTIFFLLVGLELKREIVAGELSSRTQLLQPLFAAIGGMLIPSLIFIAFNHHDSEYVRGWAIPAATDIAFALGILSLLGSSIPKEIKILLTAVAILDDLGAIIVIALFYSAQIHWDYLLTSLALIAHLYILNRKHNVTMWRYLLAGAVLWICLFKGGVHPTLAGVIMALAIPLRDQNNHISNNAPLYRLEHKLHKSVAFFVLPTFAFVNAGLSLHGLNFGMIGNSVTLGVLAGLLLGKPVGIMGGLLLGHITRLAPKNPQEGWMGYVIMAALCGIGFTMALFIGDLAFAEAALRNQVKLGILLGSAGATLLAVCLATTLKSKPVIY